MRVREDQRKVDAFNHQSDLALVYFYSQELQAIARGEKPKTTATWNRLVRRRGLVEKSDTKFRNVLTPKAVALLAELQRGLKDV